jgi:major membrane immunogen (membrane-anchored lipoprotein)
MPKARRHGVRAPLLALAIALAAVFLLAGCGDTVIDYTKTEDAIQSDLEKSLHEKITSVDCPADVKVEAGKTFNCTVDYADGKRAIATLKIRNEDADVSFVGLKSNK